MTNDAMVLLFYYFNNFFVFVEEKEYMNLFVTPQIWLNQLIKVVCLS